MWSCVLPPGYPEHWKDYSGLSISADYFVDNVVTCNQFSTADQARALRPNTSLGRANTCSNPPSLFFGLKQFAQLTLPVNKARWEMTPPTVNAYYDPTLNEMVFPAGISQSPWFFNATYPPQVRFPGQTLFPVRFAHVDSSPPFHLLYPDQLRRYWKRHGPRADSRFR